MAADATLTPMMAQYRQIKAGLPADALLLFRLGDFYELFFEDAQAAAPLLNVALTQRQGIPMCGVPHHALHAYIARLLKAGRKVALCDQTEEAKPGKLVKREVTQILSPGTPFDERLLAAERHNFLAAVARRGARHGLALVDLTTGTFRCAEFDAAAALRTELERVRPAELIFPAEDTAWTEALAGICRATQGHEGWTFAPEAAVYALREHFKVASLDGFGLRGREAAVGAAGGALHYLAQHLRRDVSPLTAITFYQPSDFLVLDGTTLRNLEILEPLHRDGPAARSLYAAVNHTATPMGARLLRDWLTQPLAAPEAIARRQDAVQAWLDAPHALERFRAALREVRDLERTLGRLVAGSGNARDLVALRTALGRVPELAAHLPASGPALKEMFSEDPAPKPASASAEPSLLDRLAAQLDPHAELAAFVARAIVDDPPLALKEGGLIRDGHHAELDGLRGAARGGKDWLAKLQQDEIARTGIASLKVGFNSVFGYYLEVTKANLAKVPPEYIRKQTVANGERFITPALKEMEQRILGAEERAMRLEYALFLEVREAVLGQLAPLQALARALAELDVLAGLAEHARLSDGCRPEVRDGGRLEIAEGRHPVLDRATAAERFVPNDTRLDLQEQQIALITGPNMAGKSTYIRQVALLALLAHVGAWVPARQARIDLVDRIFTRIGASDDLARGQSTFMVEMAETAAILHHATRRSLVILDEIGRGTSTFDGLSLAWSIVEHLHHQVGARTLFATHYHELTELAGRLPRVRNFHVAVREWNDQIVFLRKVQPGGTDKSYGIQVARLAGLPRPVIERAKIILRVLEEAELNLQQVLDAEAAGPPSGAPRSPGGRRQRAERELLQHLAPPPQLDLFVPGAA
ncbi:MAG TPA: DNA mismatch repair protein MutS [Verrucomicrobiota bacterium]|nr:DNA mismatch repair protein MutS [Verrucomicrobiota bacterium]